MSIKFNLLSFNRYQNQSSICFFKLLRDFWKKLVNPPKISLFTTHVLFWYFDAKEQPKRQNNISSRILVLLWMSIFVFLIFSIPTLIFLLFVLQMIQLSVQLWLRVNEFNFQVLKSTHGNPEWSTVGSWQQTSLAVFHSWTHMT